MTTRFLCMLALGSAMLFATGCGKHKEQVLHQRVQTCTQLMVDEKFDAAVDYCDPDVVTREGRTKVAGILKSGVGFGKWLGQLGGRKSAGFDVRKIDFDSSKTRATIQVVYVTTDANGGDRKEFPTDQAWALKNGVWYATQKER